MIRPYIIKNLVKTSRIIVMDSRAFLLSFLFCLCLQQGSPRSLLQWSSSRGRGRTIPKSKNEYTLMHSQSIYSPYNLGNSSSTPWLAESIASDADRYNQLTATLQNKTAAVSASDIQVPLGPGGGGPNNYIIEVGLGDSAQKFHPFVDTGSSVAWFPCGSCDNCTLQLFNPASSKPILCNSAQCTQTVRHRCQTLDNTCIFQLSYGDNSGVIGNLITDKISFGATVIPNYAFGCAQAVTRNFLRASGLVGLDKSPLSLISQTSNLFGSVFSYHLPSYKSTSLTGSLTLGALDSNPSYVASTPILTNNRTPSLYYFGLKGISVGTVAVSLPASVFTVDDSTGRGIIIDSGTVVSRFVSEAYVPFRDEFRRQMGAPSATDPLGFLDTCYTMADQATVPQVKLIFESGELALNKEQTMIPVTSQGDVLCLAFAMPPSSSTAPISILGNVQQQEITITYDIPKSTLSFTQASSS